MAIFSERANSCHNSRPVWRAKNSLDDVAADWEEITILHESAHDFINQ